MRNQTYNAWLLAGRVPAAGEHADHYLVNADRSAGFALFREDQTIELPQPRPDCTETITREEWDAGKASRRRKTAGPVARVRTSASGAFEIWVGSNKDVIAHLRKNGWKFDKNAHRWRAHLDTDVTHVVAALEKLGCSVVVEDDDA